MGTVNDDDGWDAVAAWLQQEIERQGLTLRRIEVEGNVAYRTVQKLLDGVPVSRRDALARLADFLGYEPDAIDRIRRGETVRRKGQADVVSIDLNSTLAELPADARQRVLDTVAEEIRKQQS
jgi:transcriptional regulator with XRE-family HTH domain